MLLLLILGLVFTAEAGLYSLRECRMSTEGAEYMGEVSTTRDGKTCQRWDSQSPHSHTFTNPKFFPDNDLNLAGNKCRNPDLEDEPWCYTTDPTSRFEPCDIPKCEVYPECKWTTEGTEYRGTLSETQAGETCIPWGAVGIDEEENYCRNPTADDGGPYCYFAEGEDDWDYCDVLDCAASVLCKESTSGTEYTGTRAYTESGKPCQRWDHQAPHSHTNNDPDMFPDDTLEDAANYCRNPNGDQPDGPWCYTRDPDVPWEYCDIPACSDPEDDCEMPNNPVKHVLHIGFDGLHATCFLEASSKAENLMTRMADKGAFTLQTGRAVLQTVSGPNWGSHVCGMNIETTGVTGNSWQAPWMGRDQTISPITTTNVPLPCSFMHLKGMDENIRTASFMNWRWIYWMGNRGMPGSTDVDWSCTGLGVNGLTCDSYVVGNASEYLRNIKDAAQQSYTFLHIDLLDEWGHGSGWCSEHYLEGVDIIDGWVGDLLDAIDDEDGEEWLVFVSTDHGGIGTSHGGWTDDEIQIPFFMRGPGVKKDYRFKRQVSNSDIIPTLTWAMGLKASPWWTGHVLSSAFEDDY